MRSRKVRVIRGRLFLTCRDAQMPAHRGDPQGRGKVEQRMEQLPGCALGPVPFVYFFWPNKRNGPWVQGRPLLCILRPAALGFLPSAALLHPCRVRHSCIRAHQSIPHLNHCRPQGGSIF